MSSSGKGTYIISISSLGGAHLVDPALGNPSGAEPRLRARLEYILSFLKAVLLKQCYCNGLSMKDVCTRGVVKSGRSLG